MKSPLRVGAFAAPKRQSPKHLSRPQSGQASRIARLSAAAAMVVGVGAASAIFVDYLADRALARSAETPVAVKPVVAKAVKAGAESKVAALAPDLLMPELATEAPKEPPSVPIEVQAPDPQAVAKVAAAVGPEHAIELPTDDPTASPIVQLDDISAEDEPGVEVAALSGQPSAMEEDGSDETLTAAISPDAESDMALEPEVQPKPKKTKAAKAKPAKAEPAAKQTEVASLPGVDIGGLAGHPSEDDASNSTVRTVTKSAKANGGGVAAGSARVTAAVNMRSSPKKGAGVLTVVPAGSAVKVLSCDGWCQISYNGRTGWIYKNFLTGGKVQKQKAAAAKPQKQKAATATAASEDQPAAPPTRKIQSSRL